MTSDKPTNIAILGSTGSIGTQTVDIISQYPGLFRASVLTARRSWQLLAKQALLLAPDIVVIEDKTYWPHLKEALNGTNIGVYAGSQAIADAAAYGPVDTVVTAMVGYSGLIPTIRAIESGKRIALANKETLVVAGSLINRMLKNSDSEIIPVDSEHSAIFQCLVGENTLQARKIFLTASGGPFRTTPKAELETVTASRALKHPNWDMGAKVTIDSASMMNKGFEMIEAKWLFGCPAENIEVVVHPQSIVHSMVEFQDGSVKAQLGIPDMHLPIRYALGYPQRLPTDDGFLKLSQFSSLTFEAPDLDKFPMLSLAYEAIRLGGNMPCALNAANEVAVDAFLRDAIRFTDIPKIARSVMERTDFDNTDTLETYIETNRIALADAHDMLTSLRHN